MPTTWRPTVSVSYYAPKDICEYPETKTVTAELTIPTDWKTADEFRTAVCKAVGIKSTIPLSFSAYYVNQPTELTEEWVRLQREKGAEVLYLRAESKTLTRTTFQHQQGGPAVELQLTRTRRFGKDGKVVSDEGKARFYLNWTVRDRRVNQGYELSAYKKLTLDCLFAREEDDAYVDWGGQDRVYHGDIVYGMYPLREALEYLVREKPDYLARNHRALYELDEELTKVDSKRPLLFSTQKKVFPPEQAQLSPARPVKASTTWLHSALQKIVASDSSEVLAVWRAALRNVHTPQELRTACRAIGEYGTRALIAFLKSQSLCAEADKLIQALQGALERPGSGQRTCDGCGRSSQTAASDSQQGLAEKNSQV